MNSIYIKKKATVAKQRKVLSEIYDLTQEAPPIVIPPTMDKNLDGIAQEIENLLVSLAEKLDDERSLWDENFDRFR